MTAPVFLLSSERSGTNLLRRRLTENQGKLFGPAPTHLLKHLYFAEPYYGDLAVDAAFWAQINDALSLAYGHFAPWDVEITVDEVAENYSELFGPSRSIIGVMHVMNTIYAMRKGFEGYFCKDNNLFDFVPALGAALPEARYVYLHRDPRDVVASQLGRPTQNHSTVWLAQLWRDEQLKCIRATLDLEASGRLFRLSYEEMIADEADALARLCAFLDVAYEPATNTNIYKGERTEISEWRNLDKPTFSESVKKYRQALSKADIRKIEATAWYQMRWLGYEPENDRRPALGRVRRELDLGWGQVGWLARLAVQSRLGNEAQRRRSLATKKVRAKWL